MQHCLALEGMHFYANHGYYAHEKEVGGNYIVDIYLYLSLEKAGKSDKLDDTVNYEKVFQLVKQVMENPKHLIESLAHQIINQLESDFKDINKATVRVTKVKPPIKGDVAKAYVEFTKEFSTTLSESNYWAERAKY